jgi:hypothetical protein
VRDGQVLLLMMKMETRASVLSLNGECGGTKPPQLIAGNGLPQRYLEFTTKGIVYG